MWFIESQIIFLGENLSEHKSNLNLPVQPDHIHYVFLIVLALVSHSKGISQAGKILLCSIKLIQR